MQCSNLGPLKKQRKGSPSAKQASDAAPPPEALSTDADPGEQEAYASSCSSDAEEESAVVQELEEEVRRLHDQVSGQKQQHGCLCLTANTCRSCSLCSTQSVPWRMLLVRSGPSCAQFKWEGIQRILW